MWLMQMLHGSLNSRANGLNTPTLTHAVLAGQLKMACAYCHHHHHHYHLNNALALPCRLRLAHRGGDVGMLWLL
jgi:hypothetical protein